MAVADKYVIARELATTLRSDKNIMAVALCGGRDKTWSSADAPSEMLIVVSRMPLDLDGFGRRVVKRQDFSFLLTHYTPQWLETSIEEEAGCWLVSGRVLYSKTLFDSGENLLELRKAVHSATKEKRMEAYKRWLAEARAFPAILLARGPSLTTASQRTLLRDDPALARVLFLLNGVPPSSEESLIDDMLRLERLPPGI